MTFKKSSFVQPGETQMNKKSKFRLALGMVLSGAVFAIGAVALEQMSPEESLRVVTASGLSGTVHVLPATMETTQWGWFNNAQPPVMRVNSGDTVVLETMMHSHNK